MTKITDNQQNILQSYYRTTPQGKKELIQSIKHVINKENQKIIMSYFISRYYHGFFYLTRETLRKELSYLLTKYDECIYIKINGTIDESDPPIRIFSLDKVKQFYKSVLFNLINSEEFSSCTSKTKQNEFLSKKLPYIQSILDCIIHIKQEGEIEKRDFIE